MISEEEFDQLIKEVNQIALYAWDKEIIDDFAPVDILEMIVEDEDLEESYLKYVKEKLKTLLRKPTLEDFMKIKDNPKSDKLYFCFIENSDMIINLNNLHAHARL